MGCIVSCDALAERGLHPVGGFDATCSPAEPHSSIPFRHIHVGPGRSVEFECFDFNTTLISDNGDSSDIFEHGNVYQFQCVGGDNGGDNRYTDYFDFLECVVLPPEMVMNDDF